MSSWEIIAKCHIPGEDEIRVYGQGRIEQFTDIDDYWMKRTGLIFYPFDRTKQAYFFPSNEVHDEVVEYEISQNEQLSREEYETSVIIAQESMSRNEFSKVVLARNKQLRQSNDADAIFERAQDLFPEAYSFQVNIGPETWIGASPELLMDFDGEEARTMALAGTKGINESFHQKEQEEQTMVEAFIEEKIDLLGLKAHKGKKSELTQGDIKHLMTPYSIACDHAKALELLKHLHPTSAVCGLPRDTSFDFIQNFETLNRNFYSGLTGILDEDSALFFVNLRCMRIRGDEIELFAGAGITQDSVAEEEWLETERKLAVIEQLLG